MRRKLHPPWGTEQNPAHFPHLELQQDPGQLGHYSRFQRLTQNPARWAERSENNGGAEYRQWLRDRPVP